MDIFINSLNWGDVATWVSGIMSIALFILAFLQIHNDRQDRIKREKRSQADLISGWITDEIPGKDGRPYQWIEINNGSTQPIYQAIVGIAAISQSGLVTTVDKDVSLVGMIPPGRVFTVLSVGYHGMGRRPGVEIGFHDSSGNKWIRRADGELREIGVDTVEYYEINLPTGWQGYYTELPDPDDDSYYFLGEN